MDEASLAEALALDDDSDDDVESLVYELQLQELLASTSQAWGSGSRPTSEKGSTPRPSGTSPASGKRIRHVVGLAPENDRLPLDVPSAQSLPRRDNLSSLSFSRDWTFISEPLVLPPFALSQDIEDRLRGRQNFAPGGASVSSARPSAQSQARGDGLTGLTSVGASTSNVKLSSSSQASGPRSSDFASGPEASDSSIKFRSFNLTCSRLDSRTDFRSDGTSNPSAKPPAHSQAKGDRISDFSSGGASTSSARSSASSQTTERNSRSGFNFDGSSSSSARPSVSSLGDQPPWSFSDVDYIDLDDLKDDEGLLCEICQEVNPLGSMLELACHHAFCIPCLSQHGKVSVESKKVPVPCPAPECGTAIDIKCCELFLEEEPYNRALFYLAESSISAEVRLFCPHKECSMLMAIDPMGGGDPCATCTGCKKKVCIACRLTWHEGATCSEYQSAPESERDPNDFKL